jgi:hypothetical protein
MAAIGKLQDAMLLTRFLSRADTQGMSEDECWVWQGNLNSNGYGRYPVNNQLVLAHRVSYQYFFGEIPKGMNVCHSCDNRKCINPHHLWLGTQSENLKDAVAKNRMYRPNTNAHRNGNTKLTWPKVNEIRKMYQRGLRKKEIAQLFLVSPSSIGDIISERTWRPE